MLLVVGALISNGCLSYSIIADEPKPLGYVAIAGGELAASAGFAYAMSREEGSDHKPLPSFLAVLGGMIVVDAFIYLVNTKDSDD